MTAEEFHAAVCAIIPAGYYIASRVELIRLRTGTAELEYWVYYSESVGAEAHTTGFQRDPEAALRILRAVFPGEGA